MASIRNRAPWRVVIDGKGDTHGSFISNQQTEARKATLVAQGVDENVDYRAAEKVTFLRAARFITRAQVEVDKAFERAVFNVVFHNRGNHPKNFFCRLGRDRSWRLAPGYDLTFNEGPGGEHQMDACGEGRNITRGHLLKRGRRCQNRAIRHEPGSGRGANLCRARSVMRFGLRRSRPCVRPSKRISNAWPEPSQCVEAAASRARGLERFVASHHP